MSTSHRLVEICLKGGTVLDYLIKIVHSADTLQFRSLFGPKKASPTFTRQLNYEINTLMNNSDPLDHGFR